MNLLQLGKKFLRWIILVLMILTLYGASHFFVFGIHKIDDTANELTLLLGDRVLVNKYVYHFVEPVRGDLVLLRDSKFEYHSNRFARWWQKKVGMGVSWLGIPSGPSFMILRVIGVPGDIIEEQLVGKTRVLLINGERLDESYINRLPVIALLKKSGFIDFESVFNIPIPRVLQEKKILRFYSYDPTYDITLQPHYVMSTRELFYKPGTHQRYFKFSDHSIKKDTGKGFDLFKTPKLPDGYYWLMGDSRHNSIDSRMFGPVPFDEIEGKLSFVVYSIDTNEQWWFLELIKHPIQFFEGRIRYKRTLKRII